MAGSSAASVSRGLGHPIARPLAASESRASRACSMALSGSRDSRDLKSILVPGSRDPFGRSESRPDARSRSRAAGLRDPSALDSRDRCSMYSTDSAWADHCSMCSTNLASADHRSMCSESASGDHQSMCSRDSASHDHHSMCSDPTALDRSSAQGSRDPSYSTHPNWIDRRAWTPPGSRDPSYSTHPNSIDRRASTAADSRDLSLLRTRAAAARAFLRSGAHHSSARIDRLHDQRARSSVPARSCPAAAPATRAACQSRRCSGGLTPSTRGRSRRPRRRRRCRRVPSHRAGPATRCTTPRAHHRRRVAAVAAVLASCDREESPVSARHG